MKRARVLRIAGTLLVGSGFGAPLAGQAAPGTVRGVVADTAGGPLEGVDVVVGGRTTRTNARGVFQLDSVPSGGQVLVARFPGHTPARIPITVSSGNPVELFVRLFPSAYFLPEIVVQAGRTGIYGEVVDAGLTPVSGAKVQILGAGGKEFLTDSTGTFSLPTIRSGVYLVRATARGFGEQRSLVEVRRGEGRRVRFRLLLSRSSPTRADDAALEDLGQRLATGIGSERLTSQQLERYESLGLCDLPSIRERLRRNPSKTTNLILNGTWVIREFDVTSLCAWRANEVDLVEFGPEYCWEVSMTIAYLISQLAPRCPFGRRPVPGHSYVILWEKR